MAALRSLLQIDSWRAVQLAAAAAAAALKNPLFLFAFAAPIHSTLTPSLNQLPPATDRCNHHQVAEGKTTLSWFEMVFMSDVGKILDSSSFSGLH